MGVNSQSSKLRADLHQGTYGVINHGVLIIGFLIFSPLSQTKFIGETGTVVGITKDVFFRGAHFERLSQIQHDCAILIETAGRVLGRLNKTKKQCDVKLFQPKSEE